MSKIKDYFFTDTPAEQESEMLANDPDYPDTTKEFFDWAKSINDNFEKEFGNDANIQADKPPF